MLVVLLYILEVIEDYYLELVNWADQHEKGRAAEILVMDAMSSKESCYEGDSRNSSRMTKYSVKRLE